MRPYLFVATLIILLSLECKGMMRDKQMRNKKTIEIIWPHIDWDADACYNFANYACKDFKNAIGNYSCKNSSELSGLQENMTDLVSNGTRQKRQWTANLKDDVEKRLENKLKEIVTDENLYVEPGVRKLATIYRKFIINWENSINKDAWRSIALLSVCDKLEEYAENVLFFNSHLPDMLDVAKVVGRHLRTQAELREILETLDINTGETLLAEVQEILTKVFVEFDTDIPDLTPISFSEYLNKTAAPCDIDKLSVFTTLFWNANYRYNGCHEVNLGPLYFLYPTFSSEYTYAHIFGGVFNVFFHELAHAITVNMEGSSFHKCVQEDIQQTSLTWECPDEFIKNAENITDEVVADKLAITMAWYTYQTYFKHLDSQNIDFGGNKLTRDQIFFVSAGLTYCDETSNDLGSRIAVKPIGEHLLGRNRVNLMIKSIPEYFQIFDCNDAESMKCPVFSKS